MNGQSGAGRNGAGQTGAGLIARLEREPRVLLAIKLVNVGLAMIWGFAVTYVFVRLLPLHEFKAFLLLVAFANFTVSADFGFSGIIYARLRAHWLRQGGGDAFRADELAMLASFMGLVILAGGVAIAAALAAGLIPTERPALFLAFYLLSALNIISLLAKRAMAALDRNMAWEMLDMVRRALTLALLVAALAGVPILLSVLGQIALAVLALGIALGRIQALIGMRARQWLPSGVAMARVRSLYLRDMGATMALTLSDVAAYNAPYLGITMATHDPRPLLVFDFIFKISRALTAVIRALTEALLPRLTAAWHRGDWANARRRVVRLTLLGVAGGAATGVLLIIVGAPLSRALFDGKAVLNAGELMLMAPLLIGLSLICVSTYVHNALGMFGRLLPLSLGLLAGSVLSVAVAATAVPPAGVMAGSVASPVAGSAFAAIFLACYALVHVGTGLRHAMLLRRAVRP